MSSRLEKIQAALAAAKGKGTTPTDRPKITEIAWKPKLGENLVRLIYPTTQDLPYYLVRYYDFGVLESYPILSPNSFGGYTDPIQNACKELRSGDSEEKALANQFKTKQNYFFPVIVRGEEAKGVQMWQVPYKKEDMVLNLFSTESVEEYGDVTDEQEGRDLRVTCVESPVPNAKKPTFYPEIVSVVPKVKSTQLGTDDQIEEWTSKIPDVYSYYAKKSNDELEKLFEKKVQKLLGEYEEQEEQEEEKAEETSTPNVEAPKETVVKDVVTKGKSAPKLAKSVDEELEDFDKMFEEKQ